MRQSRNIFAKALVLLLVVGVFAVPAVNAFAQAAIGGTLRGTVTDQGGALLSKGRVTFTNNGKNTARKQSLNAQGQFTFSDVEPGTYTLEVSSDGFKSARFENIVVNLNETRSIAVKLEVGAVSDTVEVKADSASLVTEQTSVGGLFNEERIKELPLNGRDFQNLIYLAPGVTRSASSTGQGSGASSSGARPTSNNFLIDGGDANDPSVPFGTASNTGSSVSAVPLDALGEFTVTSSNASAEFGRSSGGVVNVVSKSGSNDLHGTVWEFLRNSVLNTRGFFDPVGEKSPFIQNQFGFRLGGRLFRDKTFYSVAYEGFRQRASYSSQVTVPTSQFVSNLTNPLMKGIFSAAYPSVSGSKAFSKADPNTWYAVVPRQISNNLDADTGFVRLDHHFSTNNSAFLTFSVVDTVYGAANSGTLPGFGYGETIRPYHIVASDTHIFSSHLFNTARVTFQRTPLAFPPEAQTSALLAAGANRTAGPYAGTPYSGDIGSPNGFPTFSFNAGTFSSAGISSSFPQGRASNTFSYQDSVTYELGKHQLKAGFEIRRLQDNSVFSATVRPSVSFNDSSFDTLNAGSYISQSQNFYLTGNSERGFRAWEQGYFIQDSWRISRRLTAELGARYEIFLPFTESQNNLSNAYFLDTNGNPQGCKGLPYDRNMNNVAILNPTKFGVKPYCSDLNNIGPRVGFSYDAFGTSKTVVSGAYGVFFDRMFDNVYGNSRFNAPLVVPITLSGGTYNGAVAASVISTTAALSATTLDPALRTPYTQRYNLTVQQELGKNTLLTVGYVGSQGRKLLSTSRPNFGTNFPNSFRPSNQGVMIRSQADIDKGIIRGPFTYFYHRLANATSNYNALQASVNHRYSNGLTVQGSYSWAHSFDNMSDEISNGADSATPPATIDNLLAGYLAPGSSCTAAATNATTISEAQLTAAVRCAENNAALTTAQANVIFNQKYTKFHSLKDNYGNSAFDVRQRFAANLMYDLPFGKNKIFFGQTSNITDKFIGGWRVGSIFDTQSGTPYIIYTSADANRDGDTSERVVVKGDLKALGGDLKKSFSGSSPVVTKYACSYAKASGQQGACSVNGTAILQDGLGVTDVSQRMSRGALRQNGIFNWDLQLTKNTKFHERFNMRFSADFFNILNHTNFGSVSATMSSSTFGRSTSQRSLGQTQSRQMQFGLKLEY